MSWTRSYCSFSYYTGIRMTSSLKKRSVKLDLWTDIDMLLIVEKGIKGGVCHAIYWCAKASDK